tara:strand:- start:445 stop:546 length:102 start_codon:yes stop_codon:yes gene_type:complete
MKICIIGAASAGLTFAAKLIELNKEVKVYINVI